MNDFHSAARITKAGPPVRHAAGALILLHGRGAAAEDILSLGAQLALPGISLIAPEATGHVWYPNSFLAPIQDNEPPLSSALHLISRVLSHCVSEGMDAERIAILGFSQGASLASEFVARNPTRYAGLVAFTGGLLGPLGSDLSRDGSLAGTPILLSSGDPDPYVPWSRVEETGVVFRNMGAAVQLKQHLLKPHTILAEELEGARKLLIRSLDLDE